MPRFWPDLWLALRYARHRPETTLLYQLVERHYPEFLTALRRRGCAVRESGRLGEIQDSANDGWRAGPGSRRCGDIACSGRAGYQHVL